jgi:hypothetical protein
MAAGDDAAAAGMDLVAGTEPANTIDTLLNITRDYIAQFHSLMQGEVFALQHDVLELERRIEDLEAG